MRGSPAAGLCALKQASAAHTVRWSRLRPPSLVICLLLSCLAPPVCGQEGAGTYRYGHIFWESSGNEVTFSIETAFTRSQNGDGFKGTAADGFKAVGDRLLLSARESPQVFFGDSQMERVLYMDVTAVSAVEDWVMGVIKLTHTYHAPNNNGMPWQMQYTGCCRLSELQNNGGSPWVMTADIDLNRASKSPRSTALPVITVPHDPVHNPSPKVYVAADQNSGVMWSLGKPFAVGGGVYLDQQQMHSYLSVNLQPVSNTAGVDCAQASSNPVCMYKLLTAQADVAGLTVEGWVKIGNETGGYVMSTSSPCSSGCVKYSSLYIHVTATSVTVGHQEGVGSAVRHEQSMMVCSNKELCDMLKAADKNMQGTLTNKWVHIAVVHTPGPLFGTGCLGRSAIYSVYVNGLPLGVSPALCGVSPAPTDQTQLHFGAFLPEDSVQGAFLDGSLTEFRLWHGVRTAPDIKNNMMTRLNPARDNAQGDPTQGSITNTNYMFSSVLCILYDFSVPCSAGDMMCPVTSITPIYPKQNAAVLAVSAAGTVLYTETDASGVMYWQSAADITAGIDENGGATLAATLGAGMYQMTVYISYMGSAGRVPVDFLVNVIEAEWDLNGAYKLCPAGQPCSHPFNQYMPSLKFMGSVMDTGDCSGKYIGSADSAGAMDIEDFLYPCSISGYAGFALQLSAVGGDMQQATLLNSDGTMSLMQDYAYTQVGFNVGRVAESVSLEVKNLRVPSRMDMTYLPCSTGGEMVLCVQARDFHRNLTNLTDGSYIPSVSSDMKCVRVTVEEEPAPFFDAGRSQVDPVVLTIGKESSLSVHAADANCGDSLDIGVQEALPAEARLTDVKRYKPESGPGCVAATVTFMWTPSYMHGGYSKDLCFVASDTGGSCQGAGPQTAVHCVRVQVQRCVYAIQFDQQLQHVAAIYGTDWMRMWSVNAGIRHPDYVPYTGQTIMVGMLYKADSRRESPQQIGVRMGMTRTQMVALNFDLADSLNEPLEVGQMVCVIPNSCMGQRESAISGIKYLDEQSVAQSFGDTEHIAAGDVRTPP